MSTNENQKILLSKQLIGIVANSTDPDRAAELFKEAIDYYSNQYTTAIKNYNSESVANSFNHKVSELVQSSIDSSGVKVSCKRGCSYCCYQNTDISYEEAKLILEYCIHADIKINFDLAVKQSNTERSNLDYKDRKCIFLKDNECSIYDYRPHACRKYVVVGDPKDCNSSVSPDGPVAVLGIHSAESVSSAIYMSTKLFGDLPVMLLKVLSESK